VFEGPVELGERFDLLKIQKERSFGRCAAIHGCPFVASQSLTSLTRQAVMPGLSLTGWGNSPCLIFLHNVVAEKGR
jgi:hypothetical protein